MQEYKYTYNKEQGVWFTNMGGELIDVDTHRTTKKIFFKFKNNDKLQELYDIWNSKSKEDYISE